MRYYFFKKSYKSFFENISLNTVSVGIISIIFIVFSLYLLILTNISKKFFNLANNISITIYFNNNADKKNITKFKESLSKLEEIKSINEFSPQDSYSKFMKMFDNQFDDISPIENPFPVSFSISLVKIIPYEEIKLLGNKISNIPGASEIINEIDYGSKWLENALKAISSFKKAGLIFLAILFSGLFMIVFNTKKLILMSRKKEIEVMKIMGATNTFIMLPFIIEAFFLGLFSSSISIAVLYMFWSYLKDEVFKISFLFTGFSFFNYKEIIIFIALGKIIVLISTVLSMKKFLKDIN